MIEPILVVGTGRCGTSFVTKILMDSGVFMGSRFVQYSGEDVYEDRDFKDTNDIFITGRVTYQYWEEVFCKVVNERLALNQPWGWKDPMMTHNLGLVLQYFDRPKIIWCQRRHSDVVDSIMRTSQVHTKESVEELVTIREHILSRMLVGRDVLDLAFNERREEDEIKDIIRGYIGRQEYCPEHESGRETNDRRAFG